MQATEPKQRRSIALDVDQIRALERLAQMRRCSASVLIRQAIDMLLHSADELAEKGAS